MLWSHCSNKNIFMQRLAKTAIWQVRLPTSISQIPLGSSRLDAIRLDTFDVSSPCILAVSSLSNVSTQLTRRARLTTGSIFDTTSATGATRNLVCCVICIKLWYVSYSLIYWSTVYINLIYFIWRNK